MMVRVEVVTNTASRYALRYQATIIKPQSRAPRAAYTRRISSIASPCACSTDVISPSN